jgi:hypothetical protein
MRCVDSHRNTLKTHDESALVVDRIVYVKSCHDLI